MAAEHAVCVYAVCGKAREHSFLLLVPPFIVPNREEDPLSSHRLMCV